VNSTQSPAPTGTPAPGRGGACYSPSMHKKVLLVGLRSESVDFEKWPELTKETLESAFSEVKEKLAAAGFDSKWCLTDDGDTASGALRQALESFDPDIVSIGAGVRADPDLLLLFEELVNVVHRLCPRARLAFNTDPPDTIASVQRAARALDRGA